MLKFNMLVLSKYKKIIILVIFSLLVLQNCIAHPMDEQLNKLSQTDAFTVYLKLGFIHIIPLGLDHILFVLCLFLLSPKLKPIFWQATTFTIAHTITLGLTINGAIAPPIHFIEPIIALSIMFLALENIITEKFKSSRLILVFIFGLIHGVGFASALSEYGLPPNKFYFSLFTFNLGVELGQLSVILIAWILIGKWFSKKIWYRQFIVIPISIIIAAIALYWTINRVFIF